MRDCPIIAEAKKSYSASAHVVYCLEVLDVSSDVISSLEASNKISSVLYTGDVQEILLDNQASVSIFGSRNLLHNLRSATHPIVVSDAPEARFTANQVGDFKAFHNVYFSPHSTANILPFQEIRKYCQVSFNDSSNTFQCIAPYDVVYNFKFKDKHYVYTCDNQAVFVASVDNNKLKYSARQIQDADRARALSARLGYPSVAALIQMINSGSIINCPVTAQDIARAHDIYGPELGVLKGKATKQRITSTPLEFLPREITSSLVLHVDIMFVDRMVFLLSVATPLCLTMVTFLGQGKGSRALASVRKALLSHLDLYTPRQFTISAIKTDNEVSIIALLSDLHQRGIVVNIAGAGAHVPVIERKIREVKERARAILATLPFKLATTLLVHLINFVVARINLMPHRAGLLHLSPVEAFRGRKIDFHKDLRVGFGEYCEVVDRSADNTMRPRTQAAISL